MKAVALLVIFAGYTAVCYGIDHLTGHCTSFKSIVWPVNATAGDISVNCSGFAPSAAGRGTRAGTGNIGAGGNALARQVVTSPLAGGSLVQGPTGVPQPKYLP